MSSAATSRSARKAKAPWVVIAGGGTAGHVLPALSVAHELVRRGIDRERVSFVGSSRGLEARLVPESGFTITLLSGRGIQRKISAQNIASAWGLLRASGNAFVQLVRHRPAVVFSVGGYASVPCVVSAMVLRIPIVIAEPNARAGVANRLAAKVAKASAVAFENVDLPRKVLTGNAVRPELVALSEQSREQRRAAARATLGVPPGVTMILVFGGSLGARRINDAVCDLAQRWVDRPGIWIHHVSGDRDFDHVTQWQQRFRESYAHPSIGYVLVRYEDRMDLLMSAADIAICRAGATSIADLSIMEVPTVLVPLPTSAEDHQRANALAVVADGAGVMIADADLTGERLVGELTALTSEPTVLESLALGQRKRARPNAAAAIVDLLIRYASTAPTFSPREGVSQ